MMEKRLDLNSPQFKQKLINTIVENSPVSYVLIDKSYRIQFANKNYLQLRNLLGKDIIGKKCYDILNGGAPCEICPVRDAINSGQPRSILLKDMLANGSVFYLDDLAVPIMDQNTGEYEYILQIVTDRTKEVLLEEQTHFLFIDIINSLLKILEKKDPYTCQHSREVSATSSHLTWYMGLGVKAAFDVTVGGLLHDLGKLHIPDPILNKRGKLDEKEFEIIKEHPLFTYSMLPNTDSFRIIRDISIAHHERWDGMGYPNGLKGDEIPLEARITAIADAYNAMISERPYREGYSHQTVLEEIKRNAGAQFDPDLVEKFLQMIEDFGLDEDSISFPDQTSLQQNTITMQYVQRDRPFGTDPGGGQNSAAVGGSIHDMDKSNEFIEAVFYNTTAFCMIVDDEFNVLYVSDKLALAMGEPIEKFLAGKCYETIKTKESCCQPGNNSNVLCPVAKAFNANTTQHSLIEMHFQSQPSFFDVYAVPLELEDTNGNKIRCCLEVLFDRTKEKNIQNAVEEDLMHLISKMYGLVAELDIDISRNAIEIADEVNDFNEYLKSIQQSLLSTHKNQ
jgi:HD-GYP domain-containing protein (c-di-GMP phosphodiesterase class II)